MSAHAIGGTESPCVIDAMSLGETQTTATVDERLRFAIANKRLIRVGYNGRMRTAEPHDYGIQHGTAKVLVYQVRMQGVGWRLFEISKIESLAVLNDPFRGSRRESHQHHMHWDVLFARVE